jgi:hypothetical protein
MDKQMDTDKEQNMIEIVHITIMAYIITNALIAMVSIAELAVPPFHQNTDLFGTMTNLRKELSTIRNEFTRPERQKENVDKSVTNAINTSQRSFDSVLIINLIICNFM